MCERSIPIESVYLYDTQEVIVSLSVAVSHIKGNQSGCCCVAHSGTAYLEHHVVN